MDKQKSFDCVAVKNAIQAQLEQERVGLSPDAVESARQQWLLHSENPMAKWWRELLAEKSVKSSE